jgi:hypothetical protein
VGRREGNVKLSEFIESVPTEYALAALPVANSATPAKLRDLAYHGF